MTFLIFLGLGAVILAVAIGLALAARQIMGAFCRSYEDELEAVLAQNLEYALRNTALENG